MGLTGLERKLVLDYLKDGDASLTVACEKLTFPIALKRAQYDLLEQGILILKTLEENPQKYDSLENQKLRVQFYFNKLALFFESLAKKTSAGIALVIPAEISKIDDKSEQKITGFYATVFLESDFSSKSSSKINIDCASHEKIKVFERPQWSELSDKNLDSAKEFVKKSLGSKNQDNCEEIKKETSRLIRICRYLFDESPKVSAIESIENRVHSPKIIYADEKSVIFASKKQDMCFSTGHEYAILFHFPVEGPLKERKIYISCVIESVYENYERTQLCAIAKFISVKEEDERFLLDYFDKVSV